MIVILLGILDIFAGLSIFTLHFTWGPALISFFIAYLTIKSLPFIKSIASIIDILVAGIFIFALLGYTIQLLNILGALWLIQKGIVSFL